MKRYSVVLFAALAMLVAGLFGLDRRSSAAPAYPAPEDNQLKGSYRVERGGWIYVHLEGTPSQVGYQHGNLLANEIKELLGVEGPYLKHTTGKDWTFYRDASRDILWPRIDAEYRQELDGIAAGAQSQGVKIDRWDVVALNALEELPGYYLPWLEKQQGHPAPVDAPDHCSAFVATGSYTSDHHIVMGHNNWSDYVSGARWNIIFDIAPEHGYRFLMDGLPGVIISDDDFDVNSAGLVITETTIGSFDGFDPKGSPEFYRARKALQYASSIDDYVRIMLDGNNGGYANDWLLGDNKTGEIALFELGLKNHKVWRTSDGYFIGSNFPVDPKLAREETHFDSKDPGISANARRTRWEQLMKQARGQIDIELAKKFESDGFDVIQNKVDPAERSLCGCNELSPRGLGKDWGKFFPAGTVQSKVIDSTLAKEMSFWAALGHQCAKSFIADDFLKEHPEYEWMRGLLKNMYTGPWTEFSTKMK